MAKRAKKNPAPTDDVVDLPPAPEAPVAAAPAAFSAPVTNPTTESDERTKNPPRSRRRRKHKRRGRKKKKGRKGNPMPRWAKAAVITGAVVVTGALGYGIYNKITSKRKILKCGEKYRHLVVTADGHTLEDSYGTVPTAADFEEWLDLAKKLALQAKERFNELGRIECEASGGTDCGTDEASGGSYPRWNALVALNNRMVEKLDEFGFWSDWDFDLSYAPRIQRAQAVIFDALCLMEKADEGIAAYGGEVPVTPSVTVQTEGTPAWKWFALGGAATIAAGGIGYALSRNPSSSSSSSELPHRPSLPPARAHATRPE